MSRRHELIDIRRTNDRQAQKQRRRPIRCYLPRVDTLAEGLQVGFVLGNIVGFLVLAVAMIVMGVLRAW